MRLSRLRIRNFRAFSDAEFSLDPYTCFVGPNGAGKSTVLTALNVFFQDDTSGLSVDVFGEEDFHRRNTAERIEITLHFSELSPEAQEDFRDYYRNGALVVSAVARFDAQTGEARVKQVGLRPGLPAFAEYFAGLGDGKKTRDLIPIYERICEHYDSLRVVRTEPTMTAELRRHEADHPEESQLLESDDEFYGFAGSGRLARYVQWVYVPAVKDASTEGIEEKDTALGRLLLRTARREARFEEGIARIRERSNVEYQQLLAENQGTLDALANRLSNRMVDWAHPDAGVSLAWMQDGAKTVRIESPIAQVSGIESGFEGALARFGHGFQRSYLLALLQELASGDAVAGPRLLLGCEEPELYQHPPQARHLSNVLVQLSKRDSQVLVCTHSPLFVVGEHFESVRMVRRSAQGASEVASVTFDSIAAEVATATGEPIVRAEGTMSRLHQCLRPMASEMFFANRAVLVEGYEDAAYLLAYLELLGLLEEFRRIGAHIVPVGLKSHLPQSVAVARLMKIPTFVVLDGDSNKTQHRARHEQDNRALLRLSRQQNAQPFPAQAFVADGVAIWPNEVADTIEAEFGNPLWQQCQAEADRVFSHAGSMKKNSLHIGAKLAHGWDNGGRSTSLEAVCRAIADARRYLT